MSIALLIAFIISNIAWLYVLARVIKEARQERWELQERIRQPEFTPSPAAFDVMTNELVIADTKPEDEFDVVGQINPDLPLRDDE